MTSLKRDKEKKKTYCVKRTLVDIKSHIIYIGNINERSIKRMLLVVCRPVRVSDTLYNLSWKRIPCFSESRTQPRDCWKGLKSSDKVRAEHQNTLVYTALCFNCMAFETPPPRRSTSTPAGFAGSVNEVHLKPRLKRPSAMRIFSRCRRRARRVFQQSQMRFTQ